MSRNANLLSIILFGGFIFQLIWLPAQYFPQLTQQNLYDNQGNDDYPRALLKDPYGNLVIGGHSDRKTESVIWVIGVDTLGQLLWKQELPLGGHARLNDMVLTPEGKIAFVGVSASLEAGFEEGSTRYWGDFVVGKLSLAGDVEWLQFYGGSQLDQAFSIVSTKSSLVVAGETHSSDGDVDSPLGMGDVWTLHLSPEGEWLGGERLGGRRNDWATSLATCANGDLLLAGITFSSEINGQNPGRHGSGLLARLDGNGRKKWIKSYATPDGAYFTDVVESPGGRIALTGRYFNSRGKSSFWWLLLDRWGEKVKEYMFGENRKEELTTLTLCEDNGWLLGGYATGPKGSGTYSRGRDDFWMIRLDQTGRVIWKQTFGGADHERCRGVLMYRPGVYFAIGEKWNHFDPGKTPSMDYWLVRIEDKACEYLKPEIFVRADKYRVKARTPVRFRARHQLGERFIWNFGDGTHSEEENPLKYFEKPGKYPVRLTIFKNESCRQSVTLEKELEVR